MNINELIKSRRAIYPKNYAPERPIARETIVQLLENANWAPTHRRTEPWRFRVFHSEAGRRQLGDYLADFYKNNTPAEAFSADKYAKMQESVLRAGAVIAICMQRDPTNALPEFEEIASVAMAVQNMWLTCADLGLGSYWSTPRSILQGAEWLGLGEGERCLGLFYLGWHDLPLIPGKRNPVEEKTTWL